MCKLGSTTKRNGQYQTLNAFAMPGTSHRISSLISIDSLLSIDRASTLICLIDKRPKPFLTDFATEQDTSSGRLATSQRNALRRLMTT